MAGTVSSCLRTNQESGDEKSEISQITDYLFLSGCSGLTPDRLKSLGVTCVINCIKGIKQKFPHQIQYHYIPVEDDEKENLRPYFDFVVNTIESVRNVGGKTLVYCGLGISRSATFIIAYFMNCHKKTLAESYKLVQSQRSIICPNVGFFMQLLEMEKKLYGEESVQIIEPAPGVLVPDVVWKEVYDEVMEKMKNS